ncbi:MAG: sulfur carrier protein ThiS, partial [Longimicrobiales bacterium]
VAVDDGGMMKTTETERVEITLNGEPRRVPAGLDLAGLLRELELDPRLIVVEHNREIIRAEAHAGVPVEDGDVIELVHFVGGG